MWSASEWRTLTPPPRAVDWALLGTVLFETATGLYAFTVAQPSGWYWTWSHRVVGLAFVGLLGLKLARVRHRLTDRERWRPTTALSILTLLVALATLATGLAWIWVGLVWVGPWTLLSVHVGLGLLLVGVVVAHLSTRYRPPARSDLADRRTALTYFGLLAAGGVAARLNEVAAAVAGAAGRNRRFSGSKRTGGEGPGSFPVTMWVADDPDPIPPAAYELAIVGRVEESLALSHEEVTGGREDLAGEAGRDQEAGSGPTRATERALLDCTSGWYTVQDWGGVRVGDLLERAGLADGARYVRFVSVTGYRWSLPVEEAREALLATHVGGEPLPHGHGAPARLVAPGRRGFQWVKWVERIEVRSRGDPAQWLVTLVSGFD